MPTARMTDDEADPMSDFIRSGGRDGVNEALKPVSGSCNAGHPHDFKQAQSTASKDFGVTHCVGPTF